MMFTLVFVAVTSISLTYAANPEFCKSLSQCMTQGEQYYSQLASLKQQQASAAPAPKNAFETCKVEYVALQNEYNNLISERNLYLAQCVESRADQNTVANTSLARFNTLLNTYVKSSANQASPTDKVTLSVCKCEQSAQINNQQALCNNKRSACNALASSCSQLSWCTKEKYQKEKNASIVRQNDLSRNVLPQKLASCNALNAPVKPAPAPLTTLKPKVKREVEEETAAESDVGQVEFVLAPIAASSEEEISKSSEEIVLEPEEDVAQ